MAKSRVEKNKDLYGDIELESFEIEDLSEASKEQEKAKEAPKAKKHEMVKVKKNEVVEVKEEKKEEAEVVVEQPLSYTDRLSVEEILRAKLEEQQKLKNNKRLEKRSPVTDDYSSEMMQKNITQTEGVDVRKEVNVRVRKNNNVIVFILAVLLVLILVAGGIALYFLLK